MSSNNKNILSKKKKVLYYFLNDVIRKCLFSYMEEFEFLNLMPIPLSLCDRSVQLLRIYGLSLVNCLTSSDSACY